MKKNLSIIFLVLGTIIGAGFCSGKELVVYFAKFGFGSLFFVPVFFVVYYFLFKLFLNLGRQKDYKDFSSFNKDYGKSKPIDFMLCLTYIVFSSAMFACLNEMSNLYFNDITAIILMALCFVFSVFMLLKSFKSLTLVNFILIPIVLVCVTGLCIAVIFTSHNNFNLTNVSGACLMFFNPVIYACQGITLSYYILVKAGHGLSKKNVKVISLTCSVILSVVLALAIITFNLNPQVMNQPLPFVSLSFSLGFPFDLIYSVVLLFAVVTTLLSSTRALFDYLIKFTKKPILTALLTSGVSFILSFFGFSSIVESLYPLIGCLGAVIVLRIVFAGFIKNTKYNLTKDVCRIGKKRKKDKAIIKE